MKYLAIFGLGVGLAMSAVAASAQVVAHGATEYKLCASCHGFMGEGNQLVNAPALAGQQGWYLERQITNFRQEIRGGANGDANAQTMALMASGLDSNSRTKDIVAYIATLPAANPEATLQGDTEKGRALYSTCAACHGTGAEGNEALNAPALTALGDWYQLSQLKAFKDGNRGTHPDDIYGQQMRPMAGVLADEQAMRDVVSYIATLK